MEASIVVKNLTLVLPYFVQPEPKSDSWLGTLFGAATSVPRRRYATLLNNLNFTIREGERIALIGRNGAGKSTLLRVLAGSFQPTSGSVQINGSRQALLSMGLGFNGEATVKENIYLRASAMGFDPKEVKNVVDTILAFAELKEKANDRLHTLSSGQRMRLGFSISTSRQHDIMLLDEWFGTGDFRFVRKARERMNSRADGSKIIVVASHNRKTLERTCNRGFVLEKGEIVFDGSVKEALEVYKHLPSMQE